MYSARILLLTGVVTAAQCTLNIPAMFPAIMERERDSMKEPCDTKELREEYDFIVVGAGTAGCVVANRLTENKHWSVLLLEAGGEEPAIVDVPGLGSKLLTDEIMWRYKTVPSETNMKAFKNQQFGFSLGKVMGGCSSVNTMVNVRGGKHAYDKWEELGNPGWKYNDVLPYFKKVEKMEIPELRKSKYHSDHGKIKINFPKYRSKLVTNILEASEEMGYPEIDYNGETLVGSSLTQSTIGNNTRWSSSRGYLHPIRHRKNFHVQKRAMVQKILIDEETKVAYAVQFTKENVTYTVRAKKEVILSAGSIRSPQLLMISGVGPREHLEELGIQVFKDSPVGFNAVDHSMFLGLIFTMNQTIDPKPWERYADIQNYVDYFVSGDGPFTTNWGMSIVHSFLELRNTSFYSPGRPVLDLMFLYPSAIDNNGLSGLLDEIEDEFIAPLRNLSTYQAMSIPISPKSKGRISLQSTSIEDIPLIDLRLFSNKDDLEISLAGIRKAIEFSQTSALQKVGVKLYDIPLPTCKNHQFNSDDYWRCALLQLAVPYDHLSGTCKMGPPHDKTAVVDSNLKVHGVKGLRVIDASIFPEVPSPFTQMPAYMVGEKGSDLIKADHL